MKKILLNTKSRNNMKMLFVKVVAIAPTNNAIALSIQDSADFIFIKRSQITNFEDLKINEEYMLNISQLDFDNLANKTLNNQL
ncbi:hypothetical protein AB0W38_00410 [Aliarcobacter butzleri]|uniref:hypothetical protein n=1 Tax=Aliarcobacter butzleri TaxID=28197 RepID=UPI00344B6A7A